MDHRKLLEKSVCNALEAMAAKETKWSLINCYSRMKRLFNYYCRMIAARDYQYTQKKNWADRWDAYCWLEETAELTICKIYLQAQKMVDEFMDTERR